VAACLAQRHTGRANSFLLRKPPGREGEAPAKPFRAQERGSAGASPSHDDFPQQELIHARLLASDGKEMPAQFRALMRWPDESVTWRPCVSPQSDGLVWVTHAVRGRERPLWRSVGVGTASAAADSLPGSPYATDRLRLA